MRRVPVAFVLSLVFGILSAPPPSEAQQAKRPYRIGVLHQAFVPNSPPIEGLKAGLKGLGLEEGRDVTFNIRFSRGDPQATSAAAAALVKAGVDLIVTDREDPALAAKAATQTIPIVFMGVGDPVAAGIVSAVAHPGGNLTGVSSLSTELAPKRLEVLKAVVPGLRRVWAIYFADDSSSVAAARKAHEVAPRLKLELIAQPVRSREEAAQHLRALRPGDGLLSPPAVAMNIPGLLLDVHLFSQVPAVFYGTFWVQAGALVSYGSDFHAEGVQAARLVARIVRGARPRDLPVEDTSKIELAVNLKTARALGLTIPREILARADQVVE
ncbi:MAG: ABC transporter substrate-binding protein [candidate division NC10 bacterium]|nr:ABC transporter substrate-binding protein [candidate division NC10 bacterium]